MLPTSWRRLLSLIRILLAMSCLATQLISSSFVWTDSAILFAVYTIYACVGAVLAEPGRLRLSDAGADLSTLSSSSSRPSAARPTDIGSAPCSTPMCCWCGDAASMVEDGVGGDCGHRAAVRVADPALGRDAAAGVHRGGNSG